MKNVLLNRGWSFTVAELKPSRRVIRPGQRMSVRGTIRNDGLRTGTVYPRVQLTDTYDRSLVVYDSHENTSHPERSHARVPDLAAGASREFDLAWMVPMNAQTGICDLSCQLWPPAELYNRILRTRQFEKSHWLFHDLRIESAVEIIEMPPLDDVNQSTAKFEPVAGHASAFISYSWDSERYAEWVLELAEELVRFGVNVMLDRWHLHPGEEVLHFMERGCRDCDKLLIICTPNYVTRSNERIGGVGFETVVTADLYSRTQNKRRFIPVLRESSEEEESPLPSYLGGALYVDMRSESWQGYPFKQLLRAIYEDYEHVRPSLGERPHL